MVPQQSVSNNMYYYRIIHAWTCEQLFNGVFGQCGATFNDFIYYWAQQLIIFYKLIMLYMKKK